TKLMDRRRHPRVTAELSVRIWGVDARSQPFAQPARIKNISSSGIVIQGVTHPLRSGMVVQVQLEKETAHFRVAWVGKAGGRREAAVGLSKLATDAFVCLLRPSFVLACAGKRCSPQRVLHLQPIKLFVKAYRPQIANIT